MTQVLLVLLGAGLGVLVKALVDPWLAARNRKVERREAWLQEGLDHAEAVMAAIRTVRSSVTAQSGFDNDLIARHILRSLTDEFGPSPLAAVVRHESDEQLRKFATQAQEAWRAVRFASMDDEHGVPAADVLHEPANAVQWYVTSLDNFASACRARLAG